MFKYTVSPGLLRNIKKISEEIALLNLRRYPDVILFQREQEALAQSAHASTSIEGNPLPLTEVKKILKNRPARLRESEREVINYNDALTRLNLSLNEGTLRFDRKLILDIHKRVMAGLIKQNGKIRDEAVFVNDPVKRRTIYWPPDHQDVARLLDDLLEFIERQSSEADPLILAGLFHRQFVIIHPFVDGNGRTVRLATKTLLARLGINTFHLFSFENYYNRNVSRYFENVGTRGNYYDVAKKINFTGWLEYFTGGILDELLRVKQLLEVESASPAQTPSADQEKILKHLRRHGFIQDVDYAKLTNRAKATRSLDFKKLLELDLIERHGAGRATYYKLKR